MSEYAVVVEDLKVMLNEKIVLKNTSLELEQGKILLVAGPIGAGKSTLLKVLAGIIPNLYDNYVVEGKVRVLGLDPSRAQDYGYIAYVPQNPHTFFFGRRVKDELLFVTRGRRNIAHGEPYVKALLDKLLDKPILWLSDGELYRVLVALAVLSDTKLLLLDEPTSHVDDKGLGIILEYLRELRGRGKTIIMVDHRVDYLSKYVDEILFLGDYSSVRSGFAEKERTPSSSETVLETYNLSIGYGRELLSNIMITVQRGEIVSIIGPNGSGKSTLLKTILGKITPLKGVINRSDKVFYIPQKPLYWYSRETVEEELRFYSKVYNRTGKLLDNVIELFGLEKIIDRHPYALSIGESRKLALALAAIAGPDLLVIDEPLLGLDNKSIASIIDGLLELDNSIGVLIASHNMLLKKISTKYYVVRNKTLVEG